MAANLSLLPLPVAGLRHSAFPGHLRTGLKGRKTGAVRSSSPGSSWWSPIFGWSTEPDYIDSDNGSEQDESVAGKAARSRFAPGCFTPEKARRLRMMTKETESFHDVMYHSAIASRLALDSKDRSDP